MALANVEAVLEAQGRRLTWLAKATGVHYARLYRLVRGRATDLRASEADAIANALGVPGYLLFGPDVAIRADDAAANRVGRHVAAGHGGSRSRSGSRVGAQAGADAAGARMAS